jgi:hypothetical protein
VIGIRQNNLRPEFAKLSGADGFHASLRPHRHERWSFDGAVRSFELSRTRFCAFIRRSYFKHWSEPWK